MSIHFGRDICGDLEAAETREWLVTNGIGGYASGTVAGLVTRRYHGLLVAALQPPLGRTLLVTKLDEVAHYNQKSYPLYTNRWQDGTVAPYGYQEIESFRLEGTTPVWTFALADALLEKRIWMELGANTTYIRYTLLRASGTVNLSLKALVNYRDYHSSTYGADWRMQVDAVDKGVRVTAFDGANPFYLFLDQGNIHPCHDWYMGYDLAVERYRGLSESEDHLHAANLEANLQVGESVTVVASTESNHQVDGQIAYKARQYYEQQLLQRWHATPYLNTENTPDWVEHLVLAADQFIVSRPLADNPDGKTVIAGYHWFGDWGRDTMIALSGLTISTGRPEVARTILSTFARYLDQGMLPNLFPDKGAEPEYNTVDAILWYFEAVRAYYEATKDDAFLQELFPILAEVVDWHRRGTRYNIHLDSSDGLIYAGEAGVQLTWMDAKIGDWVVTPRIGKPVEINALWYNALVIMADFAKKLGQQYREYELMAEKTATGFQKFWNDALGYCYDVIDTPDGDDAALRPNQILAVSLPAPELKMVPPLLTPSQQKSVMEACSRALLTSHGMRSLAPDSPDYSGHYGGNSFERDSVYHQGITWGWLIGPFVQAHLRVYQNPEQARQLLEPMEFHLQAAGLGNISEIFDGDSPMTPRGCIAQAWSVAEVLRTWLLTN